MKSSRLLLIPLIFLFTFAMAFQANAQKRLLVTGSVQTIEVVNAAGEPVLTGISDFVGEKFDVRLVSTGIESDDDAKGMAKIKLEIDDGKVEEQDIEVKVQDLEDSAHYTLIIDGFAVTTFTTNHDGDAEVKMHRKID
jgi:hypothetical protein